jgi:N-acetylglucosaminyldiphosphoundecaprenol N-acetyl-beta-D-mannosaminyltransferase
VDALTIEGVLAAFQRMIGERRSCLVFNVNVDIWMQVFRDLDLRAVYESADLVLADGTPMMWAARWLGTPLPARVSGSDFVPVLCQAAAAQGYTMFFLGSAPGVAEGAKRELERRYHGLKVVGTYSPPYGFERDEGESRRIVTMITKAAPDILLAAFGAPKEQTWLSRHREAAGVPVSMGVGSSLD